MRKFQSAHAKIGIRVTCRMRCKILPLACAHLTRLFLKACEKNAHAQQRMRVEIEHALLCDTTMRILKRASSKAHVLTFACAQIRMRVQMAHAIYM